MSDFERIKQAVDLQQIITQETGIKMKGHHLEECPFCGGHGCFSIKEDLYHCFQCPEDTSGGDAITFLGKFHRLDKHEALKRAADFANIKLTPARGHKEELNVKARIFIEAAAHYQVHLSNGGKEYLVKKRAHREDVLKEMRVGWSTGELLKHLQDKGFSNDDIKASGLVRESKGETKRLYDFFPKGLAIFPHVASGRVMHFTQKDPEKREDHKFQLPKLHRAGEWRFYNQDAIKRFKEFMIVEGENDLLSILDAGVKNVIALIGQPSAEQLDALEASCGEKTVYVWADNDDAGVKYVRAISQRLTGYSLKIINHPSGPEGTPEYIKDPDEYLKQFQGDAKREIARLQREALDYLSWEISQVKRFETIEERLKALRDLKIFTVLSEMPEAEKLVYIEKLQSLGFTREALDDEMERHGEITEQLRDYFHKVEENKAKPDPIQIAEIIHGYFAKRGRFFYDSAHRTYLLYHNRIYEIKQGDRPFSAMMLKKTGFLPTKEPGRSVWEALASLAYNNGTYIEIASWINTDRNTDSIYVNLNSANNIILKISKTGISEIPNGLNDDNVLLKSSRDILPVKYIPDAEIREGMNALKELVFNNLTCDREQKYLILCWLISAFLLDFTPYMALMKFSGATASGKTTAAKLISLLLYGNEHLADPSTAAAYASASQNPLLVIDNLESEDVTKSLNKFLLLTATRGSKVKRTHGTDSDTTEEKPKCLMLVTAIEPFLKAELINRTYDIEFHRKHQSEDFVEDEVIRALIKKRDYILSSIIKFIAREVLPNLSRRRDYISILKKEFAGHAKNRTDEYWAMLMLILEKLTRHITDDDFLAGTDAFDKDIRHAWINYQNSKAKETESSSSSLIKLLDGIVREYLAAMSKNPDAKSPVSIEGYDFPVYAYQHPQYLLECIKTIPDTVDKEGEEPYMISYFEFLATSQDICHAFDAFCKNNGLRNPYENAAVFGSRLRNDLGLLKKNGWELVTTEGKEPYFKVVYRKEGSNRLYKFRKTVIK